MDDPDLIKRMDRLVEYFEQNVQIQSAPEKSKPEPAMQQGPEWQTTSTDSVNDDWVIPSGLHGKYARKSESSGQSAQSKQSKQAETKQPKQSKHHPDIPSRPETPAPFDNSNFRVDESLGPGVEFCPWRIASTYHERYIGKANKPLAKPYFEAILEGRAWDFFYIHHPQRPLERPHLLVPKAQFQAFLNTVNKKIGAQLTIPVGPTTPRLRLRFGQGGTPQPRYLMRSYDQKGAKPSVASWPMLREDDAMAFQSASGIMQDEFLKIIDLVGGESEAIRKKAREEKQRVKMLENKDMLLETQSLLRLNSGSADVPSVVFVTFDIEAIERPPNPVSEIGFAILDTENTRDLAAGPCGRDWWPMIEAFHLRTWEYSGLVNHEFVKGCPASFDFGTSTFPKKAELGNAIMETLMPYLQRQREIILVGHDVRQDIQYLSSIGVEILSLPRVRRQVDSQGLHMAWRNSSSGRSLKAVLQDLHIASKHLHNAGNDAVFTLRAMIGVAVEQIREMGCIERGEECQPALWAEK